MSRENPLPRGEHWRLVDGPGKRWPNHGPRYLLQRGAWVIGYHPDTGRIAEVFAVGEEIECATVEEAEAHLKGGVT